MNEHISDQQLNAVISSAEGVGEHESVLQHVEQCSQCRHRLEELAASRDEWSEAISVLQSSEDEMDQRKDATGGPKVSPEVWRDYPLEWTESMAKQLLSPASHPEMLGRIGRYEVERLIGAGGMGIVFKAFDTELNRPVAIKLLAPHLAISGAGRKRFSREAKAAAAIVHEHVVPIHTVETEVEKPYMVMHFVAGESLQQRLDREGALELCEILRIAKQIAAGLAAAHAQGLVHRDIKPSNVLLERGVERALLTDFGLARAADDASLTRTGFHPGTPQYMSPEQARGDAVDERSDLFSLGSVLYVMCTGRAPFRAESSLGILRKITDNEPTLIRQLNPQIPDWLQRVVQRLMAKRVEERFSTAAEVAALLEECLAHVQDPLRHPLPRSFRSRLFRGESFVRRLRKLVDDKKTLALIALILLLGGILVPLALSSVAIHEERLLVFGAVAIGFSLVLALVSRQQLLSKIVLLIIGGCVVSGLALGMLFVPLWSYRRAEVTAMAARAEEQRVYVDSIARQQQLQYTPNSTNSTVADKNFGRADWEREVVAVIDEATKKRETHVQIVDRLYKQIRKMSTPSSNAKLLPTVEKAIPRDGNGNLAFNHGEIGFGYQEITSRGVTLQRLGAVAYSSLGVEHVLPNQVNSEPDLFKETYTDKSPLVVMVFFNQDGKCVANFVKGVYVQRGIFDGASEVEADTAAGTETFAPDLEPLDDTKELPQTTIPDRSTSDPTSGSPPPALPTELPSDPAPSSLPPLPANDENGLLPPALPEGDTPASNSLPGVELPDVELPEVE
jgi:hypothetical protein